jgi:L-iditol 2-dehydrogenase
MKALVKVERGSSRLELREVPEPQCGPGQVKLRVQAVGICGTDIHIREDRFPSNPPVILGHEFAGTVVEVGSGVGRVTVGSKATVLPSAAVICGHCRMCRAGYTSLCPNRKGMGFGTDGAFTEYVVVREELVYPLAESVSAEVGALSEPLVNALAAVGDEAHVAPGDVVLVSGPGPIGQLTAYVARQAGARVILCGIGSDAARLEAARRQGLGTIVDVEQNDLADVVWAETGGEGVDVSFECAGAAASLQQCLDLTCRRGTCVLVGLAGRPVTVDMDRVAMHSLHLLGMLGATWRTWARVPPFLERYQDDLRYLISDVVPLTAWEKGFEIAESKQSLKVVLRPCDAGGE